MKTNNTGLLLSVAGALLCAHCALPGYEFDEDLEVGDGDGDVTGGNPGDGDGDTGGMPGDGDGDTGGMPGDGDGDTGGMPGDGDGDSSGGMSGDGDTGGAPSDGGSPGDGDGDTGGTVGTSPVLYQAGDELRIRPDNALGARGFFYTMMDGWDETTNDLFDDGGAHTVLTPAAGFLSGETQPCVSGTTALVDLDHCHGTVCGYSLFWGGGIGLNLNEQTGETPESLDISGIEGFRFRVSGDAGGAEVRFKVTEMGSHEDFCTAIALNEDVEVNLDSLVHNCWDPGTETLERTRAHALHWQILTSESASFTISDMCIEYVEFY